MGRQVSYLGMGIVEIGDENFREELRELERRYRKLCERSDNYKRAFRKRRDPAKWYLEQQPTKAYQRIIDKSLKLCTKEIDLLKNILKEILDI